MTIRINRRETTEGIVIELHGWLNQEVLGELEGLCASIQRPLILDLSQLAGSDETGLAALRNHAAAGCRVAGASPYIRLLLEGRP